MYSALDVARYIVDKCNAALSAITNLKLQKILYFVQAEFLVKKHTPCFSEDIYAWNYGPVVPSVYREYKVYGGSSIPSFSKRDRKEYGIADSDMELINEVVKQCQRYSASELVEITHDQAPWKDAFRNGTGIIKKEAILSYFE
ncbi:MAG: DUF4065 domain-containing protein [Oscillospiraceae bacterium]|nr:DUF4065 domain-containing protein [Oscillospiraceae bacterium]